MFTGKVDVKPISRASCSWIMDISEEDFVLLLAFWTGHDSIAIYLFAFWHGDSFLEKNLLYFITLYQAAPEKLE